MHTTQLLHNWFSQSLKSMHTKRVSALLSAVDALTRGARASVTSLGRHVSGSAYDKHKIKRMDRLLSNQNLYSERHAIYAMLCQRLLAGTENPVVIIDWSPLCPDQRWQLLRASIPVGGRALTLYEEVHTQKKLGNRMVQHRFLDHLARNLPSHCQPIIVADSGFKTQFFRYVEKLNWHWVGRIRGQDLLCSTAPKAAWYRAKSLYSQATTRPQSLGIIHWTRNSALPATIWLVRLAKKRRKSLTFSGDHRQCKRSRSHANREREPWLLVSSLSLENESPLRIKNIYRSRMQIEESFRDGKGKNYGFAQSQHRSMKIERRTVLNLIVSLALLLMWAIGTAGRASTLARQLSVNSCTKRAYYSAIFLARLLLRQQRFKLSINTLNQVTTNIGHYMTTAVYQ